MRLFLLRTTMTQLQFLMRYPVRFKGGKGQSPQNPNDLNLIQSIFGYSRLVDKVNLWILDLAFGKNNLWEPERPAPIGAKKDIQTQAKSAVFPW